MRGYIVTQGWISRKEFFARICVQRSEAFLGEVEALGFGTVGIDDMVLLEHQMDIGHAINWGQFCALKAQHVARWDEHFGIAVHQFGAPVADQHTVLGGDGNWFACWSPIPRTLL